MKPCQGYRTSRRSMLGATGATLFGLQLFDLLAHAGESKETKAEHVIFFWNGGGMSHIDTWDPKPGRPTGGDFKPISTSVPGLQISEIFPQLAQQMHHCALVRSIAGTQADHGQGTYNLQTSYQQTPNIVHPGFGSVVAHEKRKVGDLPAFVSISGRAPRASYLGQACEAYFVGAPGEKDPYLAFPEGITNVRGNQRLEVLTRFNNRFSDKAPGESAASMKTAIDDAVTLMRSPALEAFELDKVPTTMLNRYGDNTFGRGVLLAKQLVETGVRFVQVNRGGFDTHTANFPAMRAHGEVMDPALACLVEDLAASGLLQKTLIVMLSEFGRTPEVNEDAGRDHWSEVFSCFVAGGGISGGKVIGSSDEDGYSPKDNPVKVADLHATFCHSLGIDPNKEVMTPLQRPMKLVDNGSPVPEMFA